ncbi:hypothetical protein [Variovorax boronicumulans]|uniref:hypothetical protein n=1 Tax=Variovorax boronicumulans TaxID=436515 RepID=UPI001C56013E
MLRPVTHADPIRAAQSQPDETVINNVFKVMHGYYGNLFLSKFASGVLDARKRDMGVASARTVWAFSLHRFAEAVVVSALEKCQARHPEFPPSLPQFVTLCIACEPRKAFTFENAIGMSDELRGKHAAAARARNKAFAQAARQKLTGYVPLPSGLEGLKRAIANAVGAAGGDEARELLRLDRMFQGAAA